MMVFDAYIKKMAGFISDMAAKHRAVKTVTIPESFSALKDGVCVKVGPGANPGIILRRDTFLELGNPAVGSAAFFLFTGDNTLVKNGRITVIGPDIPESEGASMPFGQVLIIGGKTLSDKDYDSLIYAGFIGDMIEGYMVRSFSRNLWSRVGQTAVAQGFNFTMLGRALMWIYRNAQPAIESMEIIFVTSGADDVKALEEIALQVQKIAREIVRENWKVKGVDIDCSLDCNTCSDKPVCDDIKEVLNIRKNENQDLRGMGHGN